MGLKTLKPFGEFEDADTEAELSPTLVTLLNPFVPDVLFISTPALVLNAIEGIPEGDQILTVFGIFLISTGRLKSKLPESLITISGDPLLGKVPTKVVFPL